MKDNIVPVIIVAVLVLGGVEWWFYSNNLATLTPIQQTSTPPAPALTISESASPSGEVASVKTFTVIGSNFDFDLVKLSVKKGDTIKLTFKNAKGIHDFVLDEFKAKTKQLKEGESETIEFIADKSGSFEYYCSVGNHRAMGMKGTLVVE